MAKHKSAYVYLNTTVNGHLIEDGEIVVDYMVYPPEPDVGYPTETIEIEEIKSRKGRRLRNLYRALNDDSIQSIQNQIIDANIYGS